MQCLATVCLLLLLCVGHISSFQHTRIFGLRRPLLAAAAGESSCMKSRNIKPPPAAEGVIALTEKAINHFDLIRKGVSPLCVRIGVKKGGCSGMSYTMNIVDQSTVTPDDHEELVEGDIKCIIDPKSMLYIYGLELDYSDALIGGGFKFSNPNAAKACGCGKSFGV